MGTADTLETTTLTPSDALQIFEVRSFSARFLCLMHFLLPVDAAEFRPGSQLRAGIGMYGYSIGFAVG